MEGTVDYVEIERIDFLKDSESSFVGIQLPFYKRIRVKTISKEASKRCLTASGLLRFRWHKCLPSDLKL